MEHFNRGFTYTLLFCILGKRFRGGVGGGGGGVGVIKIVELILETLL